MSLTAILKYRRDIRERFNAEFPKPELPRKLECLAPPLSANCTLVGTAFDYLLRFYVQRLNPNAITRPWVAAWVLPDEHCSETERLSIPSENIRAFETAVEHHRKYLQNGEVDDHLLESVLRLAELDAMGRSLVDCDLKLKCDPSDFKDLRTLLSLVNPKVFRTTRACALNPDFGTASTMVEGADADLVLDDALIEIKTTKRFSLERSHFNQLVGYYCLSRIGGINGLPSNFSISKLGIYFSRHAYLWLINVNEVIDEARLPPFLEWFQRNVPQNQL